MGILPCLVIVLFVSNPVCVAGVAEHGEHELTQTAGGFGLLHHDLGLELGVADDRSELADDLWRDVVVIVALYIRVKSSLQRLVPLFPAMAKHDSDCLQYFFDQC